MTWHHASHYFTISEHSELRLFLFGEEYVWDILDHIADFVRAVIKPNVSEARAQNNGFIRVPTAIHEGRTYSEGVSYDLKDASGYFHAYHDGKELENAALLLPGAFLGDDAVQISPGVLIESAATVYGPTVLGEGTTVRQGAYVRGSVYTGTNALIGHATEAKNTIMLNNAKAGHFAYLGDSLIGNDVNLGAGTKLANLKMSYFPFRFKVMGGETLEVERRKFGAVLGDGVETGCNSVTNPGTLICQNTKVMPNASVRA
ncbi:MAG: glucose-1-phosphate thymidylyltransferase, partial [Deltaproteobacteria bacterium]|nr:glucose-1-phosphate thymidylyltransferase [Deltaproteobacteria bacterium]